MGHHLLPTDTPGHADNIRPDTMGVFVVAEMGGRMGEMADTLSDGAFLRSDALLRGLLCASAVRHRVVHTGGEPDSHYAE